MINPDAKLAHIRYLISGDLTNAGYGSLIDAITDLDAHLSAGGTPPEAWREGPDAPTSDRYWTLPADPDADHPEPYGDDTWGIVDEEAGGVVAWVSTRERADSIAEAMNR